VQTFKHAVPWNAPKSHRNNTRPFTATNKADAWTSPHNVPSNTHRNVKKKNDWHKKWSGEKASSNDNNKN
jgi:hypothetical protein